MEAKDNQVLQDKKQNIFIQRCKNFYGRTKYAIWPFVVFASFLIVTFFGNQVIYWLRGGGYALQFHKLPIDYQIPLVSWFVYFYYLTFPLGIVAFFYLAYANKKSFYNLFYTLLISFAISGVIYLFWQTHLTKPDFVPVSFTDKLVVSTWGSTDPINNFPSQHAFMAIAMIIACLSAGKDMKWWFKAFTIPCAIMIILSTFFTKQHYFIDWVASVAIMVPVYFGVTWFRARREKKQKVSKVSASEVEKEV